MMSFPWKPSPPPPCSGMSCPELSRPWCDPQIPTPGEWIVNRNLELAERYGTPLYVYDLDRVVASYRDLRNSLPTGFTIFYSLKANPHPAVAAALRDAGGWPP